MNAMATKSTKSPGKRNHKRLISSSSSSSPFPFGLVALGVDNGGGEEEGVMEIEGVTLCEEPSDGDADADSDGDGELLAFTHRWHWLTGGLRVSSTIPMLISPTELKPSLDSMPTVTIGEYSGSLSLEPHAPGRTPKSITNTSRYTTPCTEAV